MCLTPIWLKEKRIYVSCGHCKQCLLKSTYDWAHRIMVEASAHEKNCVVTLTYNDEHLPADNQLRYTDVQLFLKRFRKAVSPLKVRFFCSGEYGSQNGRPHYHVPLFGYFPDDVEYMFSRHGNKFYKSEFLNDIWQCGFATVGTLTEKSAFYCAKYLQKLNFSDMPVKPFVRMSLKPGIGYQSYSPDMQFSKKLYLNGHVYSLPRFYLKMLKRDFPEIYNDVWYKAGVKASMANQLQGVSGRDMLKRSQINDRFLKKYTLKY